MGEVTRSAEDISVEEAWRLLKEEASCQLVDVRTTAEWLYVGVPDLQTLDKRVIFCQWQSYPSMARVPDFVEALQAQIPLQSSAKLLFLCRSGQRSAAAAQAVTHAGQATCYNIAEGFEGPLDSQKQRKSPLSWKGAGLPWRQDVTAETLPS